MSDNFGAGVSRVLDPSDRNFLEVVWQQNKPPLDSELSLMGQISEDWQRKIVLRGTPSGWLGNDLNPSKDYVTSATWSNWFQFGRQRAGEKQSIMWAAINGWLVPVVGTRTGTPPGSPNSIDTWNKIVLDPPPSNSGDFRFDFVFLEVWKARVPATPSTLNKPTSTGIYRYGNVEGGASFLADDLQDPAIGSETTERVQLQYRIRVIKGLLGLATNPDGFDANVVKAQGTQAVAPTTGFTFTNMRSELGDPGLWRAGDGLTNSLGTVDGYVYAIPIAAITRRNSVVWSGDPAQNLNGGFNRNPTAIDRTGATTYSAVPTLAAPITTTATTITLVSPLNTPLPTNPASAVLIQIGGEILSYTLITGSTISGIIRGVNGTVAETHLAGSTIRVLSGRPDGLFSDQVATTDILDLRHAVNPSGFNYDSMLQSNLDKLLKGQLRSNWKRTGAGPQGPFVVYEDKISQTPAGLGVTKLNDSPDGIRMVFSDAAIQQPFEIICTPSVNRSAPNANISVSWAHTLQVTGTCPRTLEASGRWWGSTTDAALDGDQITVPVALFKTGLGTDSDQFRFLYNEPASGSSGVGTGTYVFTHTGANFLDPSNLVEAGDVLVVFSGAAKGTYPITAVTTSSLTSSVIIPSATGITYVVRKGSNLVQVRVDGSETPLDQHRYHVTPGNTTPTSDLVIQLAGTAAPFNGTVLSNLYITIQLQYGAGRGLARRPDSIQGISLTTPNTIHLLQPSGVPQTNIPLRTGWMPLWSAYRNTTYKSLVPVTAEAYADLGSKTVAITPFQYTQFPDMSLLDGEVVNDGYGLMPTVDSTHAVKYSLTDPLGLFNKSFYVTLPRHLMPGWGDIQVPILPSNNATFHQGVNFLLQSQQGSTLTPINHNPKFINYTTNSPLSYAAFSTENLNTMTAAVYNAKFVYGGINYAGIRTFTDSTGLGRKGLELPPFYGTARVFGVYEALDYKTNGSPVQQTTRTPTGSGATNLLRQNFSGPVFFITLDEDGDSTFVLNADVLDLTKSPNLISTFDSGNYVIEASIFGFDRGSFDNTQPFRLVLSSDVPTPSLPSTVDGPRAIIPGPLTTSDTALIDYSRTPYQGDAWGSQTSYLDSGYTIGPISTPVAYQLASTKLDTSNLTRPNQKALEVLASTGFITSLGTGRLSGDLVAPNTFGYRNVGYEDPTAYPPTSGVAARPNLLSGALLSTDSDCNPTYLGCTERLPLGALYRDKDFKGGLFSSDEKSPLLYLDDSGVGSGVASLSQTKTLEQTELNLLPAELSAGLPGDVLVHVDGEPGNYSLLTNFRVNRGGSLFSASGDHPGGEIYVNYSNVVGTGRGTKVIVGRAFLVRNAPTSIGANPVSYGDELMLAVVTNVVTLTTTPQGAVVHISSNGSGEGASAADLYRIEGHPLVANHTWYDVDPTSVSIPKRMT
jgi:hypothetical protein